MNALLKHIPANTLYLYVGSLLAGALNYVYNVLMAREAFLGPAEYGALAALTSLLYLGSISAATLTTTTANYVARLVGQRQPEYIGHLIRRLSWHVFLLGLVFVLLIITASPLLTKQLNLSSSTLPMLLAPTLLLALMVAITMGALQGLTAFGGLSIVIVLGAVLRLLLSVPFVESLQLGVAGALLAALFAAALMYLASLLLLRRYFIQAPPQPVQQDAISWRELIGYTHHVFWVTLGITSIISIDVVMAQHYLTSEAASHYGALSMLGRIIYFATLPLTMIMFPLVARHFSAGTSSRNILIISGTTLLILSLAFLTIFTIAPRLIFHYSVGDAYLSSSSDLWLFGLFFVAMSASTWLIHVFLARCITTVAYLAPVAVILQIVFIILWHESPRQIVTASLSATILLLAALGLTYLRHRR